MIFLKCIMSFSCVFLHSDLPFVENIWLGFIKQNIQESINMTALEIICEMKQKFPFWKKKLINTSSQLTLFPIPCASRCLIPPIPFVLLKGSEIILVLWSGTFKENTWCFECGKQTVTDRSGVCMWPCTTVSTPHPAMSKVNQKTREFMLRQFNIVAFSHRVETGCCMFSLLYLHLALDL